MKLKKKIQNKTKTPSSSLDIGNFSPHLKLLIYGTFFKVRELKTVRRNISDKHRGDGMAKGTEVGIWVTTEKFFLVGKYK